jgi:HD-GYP domain-containing protein (c-di-GMP phosphodiesterase class II)
VLYHDYHTFTHSANVAMYCAMLARALGISDRDELNAIAVGALLHDAGKLQIPASILTKPAELTEAEVAIVREHPRLGFRMLCQRPDLSFGQLMMIYQHHEKIDGSGYPVHAVGSELHDWGKMCAVTDVFEALTSNRPYRLGLSFAKAAEIMQHHPGTAFDGEMLSCWIGLISRT